VATKTAKTAQKQREDSKRACPDCGAEARVVRYVGYGPQGLFWVCEKSCGYMERTK